MPPRAKDRTAQPPPKARKSRATAQAQADDSSDVEVTSTTKAKKTRETVNWIKNPNWTDDIITYLSEDPAFRIKLFSDSTADAKQDGRRKLVGKDGKPQMYAQLAKHIFADDPDEQARYLNNPAKYATSVETRLRRLKKEYKGLVTTLGATGAGLERHQVLPGSKIASLLDDICSKWPWWDDLHAFWRELPNYNPVGVQSSEPGTDHASDAEALFQPPVPTEDEEEEGRSITSMAGDDNDDGADDQSHKSEHDEEPEDDLDDFVPTSGSAHERPSSPDPTPPPAIEPAPRKQTVVPAPKKAKPGAGRDLGLTKAHASSSSASAQSQAAKGKKPVTAIDRMNDLREAESARLGQKREMQHEEEMERIKVKRLKLEVKLLQAQNERKHLNRHAWSTPASPRSPRRARIPSRGLYSPARLPQLPYHDDRLSSSSHSALLTNSNAAASSSSSPSLHNGQESESSLMDDFMAITGYSMPGAGVSYECDVAVSGGPEPWPVLPGNDGAASGGLEPWPVLPRNSGDVS
ncbi:hypothetical protein GGX14DRAFT_474648 [Mycena pura]|uniref:Uncharacterized protein n=1 Tax=Mycena pura TaxID=153505 RepID=A0AAD6UX54_9AGAR|nr:hypothetical protein GGX14DRAFT_474648 [Mycena pura]